MKAPLFPALVAAMTMALASPAAARRCDPMRVMTYNIRLATPADGANRWEMRRDQFIGQVEWLHPDLLGLQEVVLGQRDDLARAMPDYAFLGVARDDGKQAGEFSNLAFRRDRFVLKASGTFWLSPTPDRPSKGWDAAFPRVATWARLIRKSDRRPLLVVNTHLDNAGAVAREQSAKLIGTFIARERRRGESVIVTGDFNSSPDSAPLAALLGGPVMLRDSRVDGIKPPLGPTGTFNNFNALPEAGDRIDYVLHDAAWRTVRNINLAMHGEDDRVASDHFPVIADLVGAECVK